MDTWKPSDDWHTRHDTSDLCYAVTFLVEPASAVDAVWADACTRGRLDDDGELLLGGAGIVRGGQHLVVASGGEDALDSLEAAVDEVLAPAVDAVEGARATAVREVRELVPDED